MGLEATRRTKVAPGVTANKTPRARRAGKAPAAPKKATWTLRIGPWTYNTSTGQHTFKLGKTLKYKSRTRTQRTAAKTAKTAKRTADRKHWDAEVVKPPEARTPAPGRANPKPGTRTVAAQPAPVSLVSTAEEYEAGRFMAFPERQAKVRAAGLCGARTRDGGSCLNTGRCPVSSHRRA